MMMRKSKKLLVLIVIFLLTLLICQTSILACDPYWVPWCHNNITLNDSVMHNEGWSSTDSNNVTIYSYNEMSDDTWTVQLQDCGNYNPTIYYSYESDMVWGCKHQYTRDAYKDGNGWCEYADSPVPNLFGGFDFHSVWSAYYDGIDYFDWCNAH